MVIEEQSEDEKQRRREHIAKLVAEKDRRSAELRKQIDEIDARTVKPLPSDLHTSWSVRKLIVDYGPERTVREMKKRCDAGAIIGCSIYMNLCIQWLRVALELLEPGARSVPYGLLETVGEISWADKIEELHQKYLPKLDDRNQLTSGIPAWVQHDLLDEFRESLTNRVGRKIPESPEHATKEEIAESKRIIIARAHGDKVIKQTVASLSEKEHAQPPPQEISEEAIKKKMQEIKSTKTKPTPELELMQDEIKKRMKELDEKLRKKK